MKQILIILLAILSFTAHAKDKNLVLRYTFSSSNTDEMIKDDSGNGYNAELKNHAYIDKMGDFPILNLGYSNGYVDMGEKVGTLINSLKDFSIASYVCINAEANLNDNGHFIWSFSNSNDIMKDQNGCMFFSARTQGYSISKTDYRAESGISVNSPLQKKTWKHVVYTQTGNTAKIYVDGKVVADGEIALNPKDLEKTLFNFIGRSPYGADAYFKGLISDFRIYKKALSENEIALISADLEAMNNAYADYLLKPVQHVTNGNPLFSHKHTADPAAFVYDDTFYIYAGQDVGDGSYYNMPNWVVFSSKDLETWEEHSVPLSVSDFSWAKGNTAWAAQVIERNGKFYWYISTEHASVHGKSIGVAVSDSPTGPFVDARGSALITNDMTTEYTGISWDDIDPTVWIDDDGQAYIFWGNTQCYYAKLKDNMIELDSEIMPVTLPNFTEAPWIHKRGDWYYLSYASLWPEKTCYAMSKDINGPWEYKGILNELAGNCNTNHQAIVEFNNNWYFVYHNGGLYNGGSYLRSVCIDYLFYDTDHTIKKIQMTSEGVRKVE